MLPVELYFKNKLPPKIKAKCQRYQCPFSNFTHEQYSPKVLPCLPFQELLLMGSAALLLQNVAHIIKFDDSTGQIFRNKDEDEQIMAWAEEDLGVDFTNIPRKCPLGFRKKEA